jgi:transposase
MSDIGEIEQLAARLVIGRKRDGRNVYDAQAKAQLVRASRQPGVSLSRLARQCGVNANQLSRWAREHERKKALLPLPGIQRPPTSAFVPVAIEPSADPSPACTLILEARLPNGVALNLRCELEQAIRLIQALGSVRCLASIPS